MSTKLQLINSALILIGDLPLDSLTGTTRAHVVSNALYDNIVQNELSKFRWGFARRQAQCVAAVTPGSGDPIVPLFDYIHSLDNIKLAEKIASEQIKKNRNLKIFIQVNIGNEPQKAGLNISDLKNFYEKCTQELNLNIIGLMCLPPQYGSAKNYFNEMVELKKTLNVEDLSMGMSEDYLEAVACGATYIRIGSKIFGDRS